MDDLSSPVSISSTTTTTTTKTTPASQPTYTTAGTLYKPNSSQPLQPPTRRGRSLKWSNGGAYSGLTLLPKSFLANLPVNGGSSGSLTTHVYTPLQQNYDRAVSPVNDFEYLGTNMTTAQDLRMNSENTPASPSGLFPDADPDKFGRVDDGDTSDDDDEFIVDTLINMPVKSLQNLASYSNPNQKMAQKALSRGVRPGFKVATRINGLPTPSAQLVGSPELRREDSVSPTLQRSSQLSLGSRRDAGYRPYELRRSMAAKSDDRFPNANGYTLDLRSSMTLASGPGAPRPLTAGPPGLRQYRPSTFESTFKALQPKNKNDGVLEDVGDFPLSHHTLHQAGIDDASFMSEPSLLTFQLTDSGGPATRSTGHFSTNPTTIEDASSSSLKANALEDKQAQSFSWAKEFTYKQETVLANLPASSEQEATSVALVPSVPFMPSILGVKYKAGTDRMTDEVIETRMEKINRDWYAGANFMTKTADEIVDELHPGWNAHGKSRATTGEMMASKSKRQYRPIEIQDANWMSVAEHAQPLVNMAMGTILLHQEEALGMRSKRGPAIWPLE
ncbi:Fc.00g040960.m01.CDS01 [Cosmosporella sp. VM-42]